MPSERRRGGLDFPNSQFVAGLDEVAKGLAGGTISRRRALKMTGAALLGAALVPFSSAPAEAAGRCRNRPALSNRRCTEAAICHSSATQLCVCARTVSGDKKCVDLTPLISDPAGLCDADQCERSRDCAEGEFCVKIGECCEVPERKVCARQCDFT